MWMYDNSIISRNRFKKKFAFYEKSIYQNISLCNVLSHVSTMYFFFWWMIPLTYASSSHHTHTHTRSKYEALYSKQSLSNWKEKKCCALALVPLYYSKNITQTLFTFSPRKYHPQYTIVLPFFYILLFVSYSFFFFSSIRSSDSNSMYIIYDTRGSIRLNHCRTLNQQNVSLKGIMKCFIFTSHL